MKNDVFLKKSFLGGYNKAETLIYIDEMQESIIKLQVDARSRAREILSAAEKDSKQILDTVSNYEKNPY